MAKLSERVQPILSGSWWRRRYYISEGFIKPIRDEPVDWYDPLGGERFGKDEVGLAIELARLDVESTRAVEDFTSRWGLLGLLGHRLIEGPSQIVPPDPAPPERRSDSEAPLPRPQNPVYLAVFESLKRAAMQVQEEEGPEWLSRQSVLTTSPGGLIGPIGVFAFLRPYFPQHKGQLATIVPLLFRSKPGQSGGDLVWTPELLDELCEPLEEFQSAVREFQRVYALSAHLRSDFGEHVEEVEGALRRHQRAIHLATTYDAPEGQWRLRARLPSLLSAAYLDLSLELTRRNNPRCCANETCRTPFLADRADKIYCSEKCQKQQKQRNSRQRLR